MGYAKDGLHETMGAYTMSWNGIESWFCVYRNNTNLHCGTKAECLKVVKDDFTYFVCLVI